MTFNVLLPLLVAAMLAHATTVAAVEAFHPHRKGGPQGISHHFGNMQPIRSRSCLFAKLCAPRSWRLRRMRPSRTCATLCFASRCNADSICFPWWMPKDASAASLPQAIARSHAIRRAGGVTRRYSARPCRCESGRALRVVVFRMAETGLTRMPVIESDGGKLVGMVSLEDLLLARVRISPKNGIASGFSNCASLSAAGD